MAGSNSRSISRPDYSVETAVGYWGPLSRRSSVKACGYEHELRAAGWIPPSVAIAGRAAVEWRSEGGRRCVAAPYGYRGLWHVRHYFLPAEIEASKAVFAESKRRREEEARQRVEEARRRELARGDVERGYFIAEGGSLYLLAKDSPARFNVGDQALDLNGDVVTIVHPFGVYKVKDYGLRPGYVVRDEGADELHFAPAANLWDLKGEVRHLRLVSGARRTPAMPEMPTAA